MIYLLSAIVFVLMLSVLILVHEAGHFLVARWSGVKVEEFGFGFPPRAWSRKVGETTYSVNWLPFGGFVRMLGQDDFAPASHSSDARSFESVHPLRRIAISLAGVVMNLLLAVLLLWVGYMVGMQSLLHPQPGSTVVRGFIAQSPAQGAGLLIGDELVSVNGTPTPGVRSFSDAITPHAGHPVSIVVRRGTQLETVAVTPDAAGRIGVEIQELPSTVPVRLGPVAALGAAVEDTWLGTRLTVSGLGKLFASIFTRFELTDEVGGPVKIAQVTHQAVQVGWDVVLQLAALLSLSLAVLNAMPFPALDGGHVLFTLLEIVRRRPLNRRLMERIQMTGMALLLLLIAATIYKDVLGLIY